MEEGIIRAIGNTPLLKLKKIDLNKKLNIYIKMEGLNISGSAKDRSALCIIQHAMKEKIINKKSTIIGSSSGNFGISMAVICKYFGLRFICVCDPKTTQTNQELLKSYGAELVVVKEKDSKTGEYLPVRLKKVEELLNTIENSYNPDQYSNIYNPIGHKNAMKEINCELNGKVDYIFVATSTFGTVRGYAEYIREKRLNTKIVAVDAEGSALFSTSKRTRLIPGHGAACIPKLFNRSLIDDWILVNDRECVEGCRYLLEKEAIMAGGSTGGNLAAISKYQNKLHDNANCVFVMHDRGERYLNTIYSERWVENNIYKETL